MTDKSVQILRKTIRNCIPVGIYDFRKKLQIASDRRKTKAFVDSQLMSARPIKLELGSGPRRRSGWITTDIVSGCDLQHDILTGIPFPSNSVDEIYSSHFLEHFHIYDIKAILRECIRVLRPGAKISSCVPNAAIYLEAYAHGHELNENVWMRFVQGRDINSPIDYVNYIGHMNGEHKHMFDIENLIAVHGNCGFSSVDSRLFDPHLDVKERDYQSIYVEAIKQNDARNTCPVSGF